MCVLDQSNSLHLSWGKSLAWSLPYLCHLYMPHPTPFALYSNAWMSPKHVHVHLTVPVYTLIKDVFFSFSVSAIHGWHPCRPSLNTDVYVWLVLERSSVVQNCTYCLVVKYLSAIRVLHAILPLFMYNYKIYSYNLYQEHSWTLEKKKKSFNIGSLVTGTLAEQNLSLVFFLNIRMRQSRNINKSVPWNDSQCTSDTIRPNVVLFFFSQWVYLYKLCV